MTTNAWRAKSAMIALTGGTVFLRFYKKMSCKALILSLSLEYTAEYE